MSAKAGLIFIDFEKAVKNLRSAVNQAASPLEIDGAIKRFELSYELAWKLIKEHLAGDGIVCKSPRDCFKAAKENDLIADEVNWLQMIEDRNQLVHCYTFEQSRVIYDKVKASHSQALMLLYKRVKEEYKRR